MDILEKARQYEKENHVLAEERPAFHAAPPVGWMNDPNGFSVYQDTIHLFYQYYPYGTEWGPMYWGHLKTKDMIRWEDCPAALAPDEDYDKDGCFSGSAVETEAGHVLIYTGVSKDETGLHTIQGQCIAVGDGTNYKKIAENPVITGDMLPWGFSRAHFRDPKVWKCGDTYHMAVGSCDEEGNGQIVLFSGKDVTHWQYEGVLAHNGGTLGRMWECPDFFELDGTYVLICSPQDMKAAGYEFHNGHNSLYFLGSYDKEEKRFLKGAPRSLDYGLDFYAAHTTCLPDGRRILIGWMQSWDSNFIPPEQKWKGMITLPRELSVRDGALIQKPIRELEQYRRNKITYQNKTVAGETHFEGICGRLLDLTVEISSGTFDEFSIDLAKDEEHYTRFLINRKKGLLEIDRTYSGMIRDVVCIRRAELPEAGKGLKLRFIMDCSSIELFINEGEKVLSTVIYTPLSAREIAFICDGSAVVQLEQYDIEL
ncbi:MAG: glycoside hydrolase family 32 protein [Firmicutes bacterium]|nr:glycoside hydrolase family 32 protein [Bacillota bacterium]